MLATDLEQRSRCLPPGVVERWACPLSSLSETSGPSASVRWSGGSGLEQSGSGIATRSRSLANREKRRREVPEGRVPERNDVRRGERAKRRRLRRKVWQRSKVKLYVHELK